MIKKSLLLTLLFVLSIVVAACAPTAAPAAPAATSAPAPTAVPPTKAPAPTPVPPMPKDIVDTAVAAGNFKTLATALQAAGLVDALKGTGPFTVFAPTDEAFAKLPKDTLDALLKDPKALGDILKYHVVAGKVMAADVVKLTEAETLLGKKVAIKVDGGKVMVGGANVIKTDIEASNGVIHVIDTVLLPPVEGAMASKDIVDTAIAAGSFKTLVAAVQAADLVDVLKGAGPFTVFAPTDEAFAKLPAGTVEALLKDPKALGDILKYHVVAGKVMAADVVKLTEAETLLGKKVAIKVDGGKVMVGGANVVTTDIAASNGVIHVIDTVLLPPAEGAMASKDIVDTAIGAGNFKTLVAAVQAAGLVDALKGTGPFTVFAPTDEAFAALPAGTVEGLLKEPEKLKAILLYHVVEGKVLAADAAKLTEAKTLNGASIKISVKDGKVMINDAEVVTADVMASNGVIHVINKVILPPADGAMMEDKKDIVDTAIADGRFKTLVAAVQAAGLVDALKGAGPFTVFAPTDEAFAKLPAGTLEVLLKDPKKLGDILKYHVVSGKIMAAEVAKHSSVKTLLGQEAPIKLEGGKVFIAGAQIIITDIETSNGVIHVIDTVMLPK